MNEIPANNQCTPTASVTLSLGQIALPPEQLVLLREGDAIQLPCAFPLSGALTLDGKPWAYVSIDKAESGLQITVNELVAIP